MKRNLIFSAIVCGLLTMSSCKTDTPASLPSTQDSKKTGLPALPAEMINKMLAEVDYIDYIWHDLPFSLSQEEKEGINTNISFISNEGVSELSPACKAIGRKFYNIKGETIATADVYFSPGCYYYVFLE